MTEYRKVFCESAKGGCGWWWYRREVRPHWWSRKRYEYDGAHFDGDGRGLALRGSWLSAKSMEFLYEDCWDRIKDTP